MRRLCVREVVGLVKVNVTILIFGFGESPQKQTKTKTKMDFRSRLIAGREAADKREDEEWKLKFTKMLTAAIIRAVAEAESEGKTYIGAPSLFKMTASYQMMMCWPLLMK
jgi:hypothetical protein